MANEVPSWLQSARESWVNRGDSRPDFALTPGPGQESVWDYPRPPAVVTDQRTVKVSDADGPIAKSSSCLRILETSHPPSFYLPPDSIEPGRLMPTAGSSMCEWKGQAEYLALTEHGSPVAWRYPKPFPEFEAYADWVAFYPDRVQCRVDGELVRPQAGGFYGGWITDDVVGPFKGDPGTSGW